GTGHSHGAVGHVHPTDGASLTPGAHDHGSGAIPAGIESGNGTSPCEQAGTNIEGNSHGQPGPAPQQGITDPATRAHPAEQLTVARQAALQYPTAADAMAAGYRRITPYIPCIAAHYINPGLIDRTFDPAKPEMLLFDGDGPDARIVGLSYYVTGLT